MGETFPLELIFRELTRLRNRGMVLVRKGPDLCVWLCPEPVWGYGHSHSARGLVIPGWLPGTCWPLLPYQAPVLWAVFGVILLIQGWLPSWGHGMAEPAWKLERNSGTETWSLAINGGKRALPLLFILLVPWRTVNTAPALFYWFALPLAWLRCL